jgi:cytochrome c
VVDRAKASEAGFGYSDALKAKGGKWTFEDLDAFITSPKTFVAGTKMGFGGEPDAGKRADIIVYLRSLSDAPVPLPAAK